MGIRLKFLIILLVFSLAPLFTLFFVNQLTFVELGNDIYHIAKVLLLQSASKEMQEFTENYASNINREFYFIDEVMKTCQEDVEKTIAAYSVETNQTENQFVIEKLKREVPTFYKKIIGFQTVLTRLRVYLVGGTRITYPETKESLAMSEPAMGDAKFSKIIGLTEPVWDLPGRDRFNSYSGNIFTVTVPIHNPSGSVVGAFTADFDLFKLLETIKPSSQWSLYMQNLLLRMDRNSKTANGIPLIIGARKALPKGLEWNADTSPLIIDTRFADRIKALFQGFHYGEEGYVSLPFEDVNSIWAFAHADKGLGIISILPQREILYRIARHPGRLSRWLKLESFLAVVAVVLLILMVVTHRSKRLLDPFFSMASAFKRVSGGDFSTRLEFKAKDERQMIATAFNDMAQQLEDGFRVRQALEVAQEVQQNFLPNLHTNVPGSDFAAKLQYCEETGGDYIDVLEKGGSRIGIVVGDVTGHGIGAALLMATVRALIQGHYQSKSDLTKTMNAVNCSLSADMGNTGRFVTLFILEIDSISRRLKWIRAGHDPAWLFSSVTGSIAYLDGPGIPLGVNGEFSYSENKRDRLYPGDIILVGTDGIWETARPDGTFFGKRRMEKIVSENAHRSASEICDAVMTAIDQFRGTAKQEDDVSVVVFKNLV
jgi:sigma-B regulation protein RsbU (phosphoserine phosphatase)